MGQVPKTDNFGDDIVNEFIDGRSRMGPWGFFTPASWAKYGVGLLGTGFGQRYVKREADGKFVKVEG